MGVVWVLLVLVWVGVSGLPVVDKGVFVITGVKTCREGYGYCILGQDCTVDKEFVNDDQNGHCDGLKKAFTPRAAFVCCMSIENSTLPTTTTTTSTPSPPPSIEEEDEKSNESNASNPSSQSNEDESKGSSSNESVEIPASLLNQSTTTVVPGVVEEVHTEISVSENVNVVYGDLVQKGVDEDEGIISSSTTTSSTTTSTTTTPKTTTTMTTTTTTTQKPTPQPLKLNSETCGYKATFYTGAGLLSQNPIVAGGNGVRIDSSRLAAQQNSLVCWTGAIVRSSSALTLSDPGSFICTGALISEDFLLTTATCVSRLFAQDLSLFKVALGSRHLVHPMNGPTPDAVYKDIVQLIVHEDYNIQGLFKRVNDIALVRLAPATNLRTDDHVIQRSNIAQYCTVCLPEVEEDHSGEECIVTGFSHPTGSVNSIDEIVANGGSIEAPGPGSNQVPSAHDTDGILHEADQRIEYASNCEVQLTNFTVAQNTLLRNDLNIEASKLVCGSGSHGAEACFSPRDAGSPLACKTSSDQYKLVGVFSSGFHCGTTSSPVLYTNVSKFVPWIRANLFKVERSGVTVSG